MSFHPIPSKLEGKQNESNGYHQVPSYFILFFNIQTMEHNVIPSHTTPFHPIPLIQTKPKGYEEK